MKWAGSFAGPRGNPTIGENPMNKLRMAGTLAVCVLVTNPGYGQSVSTVTVGAGGANVVLGGDGGAFTTMRTTTNAGTTKTEYRDPSGSVELITVDGQKSAVAKDAAGTELFSGPFGSEAERSAAPVSVRTRIESVESKMMQSREVVDRRRAELGLTGERVVVIGGGGGGGGGSP